MIASARYRRGDRCAKLELHRRERDRVVSLDKKVSRRFCLKTLLFLVAFSSCLNITACYRPPDETDLQDYRSASALVDSYRGVDDVMLRAQSVTKELLRRRPDLPHGYVAQARIFLSGVSVSAEYVDPKDLLHTAIGLDSSFCDAYTYLGRVLYRERRYADALDALETAERLRCENEWRAVYHAEVFGALEQTDREEEALDRVPPVDAHAEISVRTVYLRALGLRANLLFWKGDKAAVLATVRKQLELIDSSDAWGHANAASSLLEAGDFDQAADEARAALKIRTFGYAETLLATALYGQWLWHHSHDSQDIDLAKTWTEAESLLPFRRALEQLWSSLANRDLKYRYLLLDTVEATQIGPDASGATE